MRNSSGTACEHMNEDALYTREFFIDKLDFLNGELQEFVPAGNKEPNGVVALDVKWKSGVHFIIYQTPWRIWYYAVRKNEKISRTFYYDGKFKNDSSVNIQRFINDIDNGRYDKKPTPRELHLKCVQEKGLTGYMNNTKWNKVFDMIHGVEEETGREIPVMYKCICDIEDPVHYWSVSGDEYLYESMYKYIEWLKIHPSACCGVVDCKRGVCREGSGKPKRNRERVR